MISKVTIVNVALAAALSVSAKSTAGPQRISKRWESGVDCTDDYVATQGTPDLFMAIGSDGVELACSDIADVTSDQGVKCYRTTDADHLGDHVKCPGDPAPKKNPDGTDVGGDIATSVIQTYCDTAGGPAFVNDIGCLLFGYYEANGNPVAQQETGAMAVCDTIFSGSCTFFTEVGPEIASSMDKACIDDPGSNACEFASPGK